MALIQSSVGKPTWTEDVSSVHRSDAATKRAAGQTMLPSLQRYTVHGVDANTDRRWGGTSAESSSQSVGRGNKASTDYCYGVVSYKASNALQPFCDLYWTQNNCELRWPLEVDRREEGEDGKTTAQRERDREKTQCFLYNIRCETVRFRLQKYRNGRQLWVVNVFSYTIHGQTDCWQSRSPLDFSPLTVTFPKLSVILRPLHCVSLSEF
jgi:hypothetical protein